MAKTKYFFDGWSKEQLEEWCDNNFDFENTVKDFRKRYKEHIKAKQLAPQHGSKNKKSDDETSSKKREKLP